MKPAKIQFSYYFIFLLVFIFAVSLLKTDRSQKSDAAEKTAQQATTDIVAATKIDFHTQIAPILKNHCSRCHSGHERKGGFSINTHKDFLLGGEAGPIVVNGKPEESYLIELITDEDADARMPLKSKPLSKEKIQLLKDWITAGAPWPKGFRFVQWDEAPLLPRKVKLPGSNVRDNPIDRLLSVYYKKNKVKLPKLVDDRTYARRVWLDITGLLPSPEALNQFVADGDKNKRAKLVDQLLSDKKAYTEHWMTFWSDMLRNAYRGTGYIDGGRRTITQWLYNSLYNNMPYDQFTRELVSPIQGSEGFINGIKWRGNVNSSQTREMQAAQNVGQIFMGTNLKCASCHDSFVNHWRLADTYAMAAVFSNQPLELHRCDKPTGKKSSASFIYSQLGKIDPKSSKKEKMAQLAKAITSPKNGRFTRTIVNRIWANLMGRGIVELVDDMDQKPLDADLLDWLASDFVAKKYDLKHLIRLICTSNAYQLPTVSVKEQHEQAYLFRGPFVKRMTAEQFVDAVAKVTNTPVGRMATKLKKPYKHYRKEDFPGVRAVLTNDNALQRSLGRPNREQVVTQRDSIATTLQMLELTNGNTLDHRLKGAVGYWTKQSDNNPDKLIQQLYRKALGRKPTVKEIAEAKSILGSKMESEAIQDLIWIVIMLPEFQLIQ